MARLVKSKKASPSTKKAKTRTSTKAKASTTKATRRNSVKKNTNKKQLNANQTQTVEVVIDNSVLKLVGILVLGIVAVVGLLVYGKTNSTITTPNAQNAQQNVQQDATELPSVIGDSPVLGKADAPVTIFEYADFECPFCRRHELQTFPQIKKQYIDTGKVKYVAKNFIAVPSHKPSAEPTAYAAYCVYKTSGNNAFWKFKTSVVEAFEKGEYGIPADGETRVSNEKKLLAGLRKVAEKSGADLAKYDSCMKDLKYAKAFIAKDQSYVESKIAPLMPSGVGTPMFVICKTPKDNNTECKGPVIMGAYPFSQFKETIDSLLKK